MNFITVDIETTGIDTLEDVPTQIAWQVNDKYDRQVEADQILVNNAREIPEFIQNLTGITQERVERDGVNPGRAAMIYNQTIWKYNPVVLLGYNLINFDLPILQNFLARNIAGKFKFPPVHEVHDVMFIYQRWARTRKWTKLADAARSLKIDFDAEKLHDAGADVHLTWLVYSRLREEDFE